MYQVSKIFYFVTKLYMFRASTVPIIRRYQLYTWQLVCFMQVIWPLLHTNCSLARGKELVSLRVVIVLKYCVMWNYKTRTSSLAFKQQQQQQQPYHFHCRNRIRNIRRHILHLQICQIFWPPHPTENHHNHSTVQAGSRSSDSSASLLHYRVNR